MTATLATFCIGRDDASRGPTAEADSIAGLRQEIRELRRELRAVHRE